MYTAKVMERAELSTESMDLLRIMEGQGSEEELIEHPEM
jgi:hypothetical protein